MGLTSKYIIFSIESSEVDRVIKLVRDSCEDEGEEGGIQMITVEATAPPVPTREEREGEEDAEAEDMGIEWGSGGGGRFEEGATRRRVTSR
eukprot:CAMPEP_0205932056 /NCGR_PEP_ID=MMETSP1325-20131115/28805_1 /ASSEMBLY_ACC=CAM_ASM_000708 /TAXON_ID=236786 /ORGANISM="Florenciella sp., Strain RCC1007" /LENGTH=90 /DNA_ID=CAMNT_0053301725 /DNA_START=36 /DNA_END=308 /DNA_ORIENTATION=+